jgi:hypothetical protein
VPLGVSADICVKHFSRPAAYRVASRTAGYIDLCRGRVLRAAAHVAHAKNPFRALPRVARARLRPLEPSAEAGIESASATIKLRQTPSAGRCIRVLVTNGTPSRATSPSPVGRPRRHSTAVASVQGRRRSTPRSTTSRAARSRARRRPSGWVIPSSLCSRPGRTRPSRSRSCSYSYRTSRPRRRWIQHAAEAGGRGLRASVRRARERHGARRSHGALGAGATGRAFRNTPVPSSTISDVALLRASKQHVITSAGALRCWGVRRVRRARRSTRRPSSRSRISATREPWSRETISHVRSRATDTCAAEGATRQGKWGRRARNGPCAHRIRSMASRTRCGSRRETPTHARSERTATCGVGVRAIPAHRSAHKA